jgi:hypothetical protein
MPRIDATELVPALAERIRGQDVRREVSRHSSRRISITQGRRDFDEVIDAPLVHRNETLMRRRTQEPKR